MLSLLKQKFLRKLESFITLLGRIIEVILTGSSDYKFVFQPFEAFEKVDNPIQAKLLFKEVKEFLENKFSIRLKEPVVIELFSPTSLSWEAGLYQFSGLMGRYRPCSLKTNNTHLIYVLKGLSREKFKGVLVHELSHAYQREVGMLKNEKILKEGMARWLEYKLLINLGALREAHKLTGVKSWLYGGGIRKMLDLEDEVGEERVIPYLKSLL
jgi:hypothetical protein